MRILGLLLDSFRIDFMADWYNKNNDVMAFARGNFTNSVVVNSVGNVRVWDGKSK